MAQSTNKILTALSRPARSRSGSFSRSLSPCVRGLASSPDLNSKSPTEVHPSSSSAENVTRRSRTTSRNVRDTGIQCLVGEFASAGLGDVSVRSMGSSTLPKSSGEVHRMSSLAADNRPVTRSDMSPTGQEEKLLSSAPDVGRVSFRTFGSSSLQESIAGLTGSIDLISRKAVVKKGNIGLKEWAALSTDTRARENIRVSLNEDLIKDTNLNDRDAMMLNFYSKFNPSPVSLGHFLSQGEGSGSMLEDSFLFLRREIPVRLANCLSELLLLPDVLKENSYCRLIQEQFATSFKEIIEYENLSNEAETHDAFNETLSKLRRRHVDTVSHMADAVLSMNLDITDSNDGVNKSVQYFLDRLYMSWISIKMLISHHKLMYCPDESKNKPIGMVGSIDPACDVRKVVEAAFENSQFLSDQTYMDAPKIKMSIHDSTDPSADSVRFGYIPSHLYHIFFEIFKNSMRATMEFHNGKDTIPDIEVHIVKSTSDISIKISDNGGGLSRSLAGKAFMYLYTSASRVRLSEEAMGGTTSVTTPMHGLGYGLPLSRLYARYLGGDITLSSCDGFGTDVFIYLKSLSSDAHEILPIFNSSSVKKITNTSTQVADWTSTNDEVTHNHKTIDIPW